jgi:hypothetical protein
MHPANFFAHPQEAIAKDVVILKPRQKGNRAGSYVLYGYISSASFLPT